MSSIKLKKDKDPRKNGTHAELVKMEEQQMPSILKRILQDIRDEEEIPDDRKKGIIMKLQKTADLGDCNNWKCITLLSLTSKDLSRTIFHCIIVTLLYQKQACFEKKDNHILNTSLSSDRSRSSHMNGTSHCMLILLTLWKYLTAFKMTPSKKFCDTMLSHRNWSASSSACMKTVV